MDIVIYLFLGFIIGMLYEIYRTLKEIEIVYRNADRMNDFIRKSKKGTTNGR